MRLRELAPPITTVSAKVLEDLLNVRTIGQRKMYQALLDKAKKQSSSSTDSKTSETKDSVFSEKESAPEQAQ